MSRNKTTPTQRPFPFIFVSGGCRSGKSAYAQRIAESLSSRCLYLATAQVRDEEMQKRVAAHQQMRNSAWRAREITPNTALLTACAKYAGEKDETPLTPTPFDFGDLGAPGECVLLDCLTLWVSACMEQAESPPAGDDPAIRRATQFLLAALWHSACPVVIVTSEVGFGLVPPTPVGRAFRDLAGLAGQDAAGMARTVIFMISGLPLVVKGSLPLPLHASNNLITK